MAITFDQIKLIEILQDLEQICKTEPECGRCTGNRCLIGYGKECALQCREKGITYVEDGTKNLPEVEVQGGYDSYEILQTIGRFLVQCCACKKEHNDNCLISVLRNCLERIEFGQKLEYVGTPLEYLMLLNDLNPGKARIVLSEYQKGKEAKGTNEKSRMELSEKK
jgi:hypothetical protein